jgi:hypothetical protein
MIRIASAAALVGIATMPASAQYPFDGSWSLDCAMQEGDRVPMVVKDGMVTFFESECAIETVEPIGEQNQAWTVSVSCSGEGETWTRTLLLALDPGTGGNPPQLVEVDLDDGFVVIRRDWQ